MSQLVLYRKYRSKNFDDIIGQKFIVQTLRKAVERDEVAHAYLLVGSRGIGKTSLARILARAVNCQQLQPGGNPCNQCSACQSFIQQSSLDLIEIDAASHRGIDDIRFLQEGVSFAPAESKRKVYIIDEVHMLTKEAFNALLKTLEEPPASSLFILATTDINKVPETIISRCQTYYLSRISTEEIKNHILDVVGREGRKMDEEAARLIAQNVAGGMRDALGVVDQLLILRDGLIKADDVAGVMGLVEENLLGEILSLLFVADRESLFKLYYHQVYEQGLDVRRLMTSLEKYLQRLLLLKNGLDQNNAGETEIRLIKYPDRQIIWLLEEMQRMKQYDFEIDSLYFELLAGKYLDEFSQTFVENNNISAVSLPNMAAKLTDIQINPVNQVSKHSQPLDNSWKSSVAKDDKIKPKTAGDDKKSFSQPVNDKSLAQDKVGISEVAEKTIQLTEEILDKQWSAVIGAIMEENRLLGTILKMSPVEVRDGQLIVKVVYNLQKEQLEDARGKNFINDKLRKVMGGPVDWRVEVGAGQLGQKKKQTVENEMQERVKEMSGQKLVDDIVEIFEGEVL